MRITGLRQLLAGSPSKAGEELADSICLWAERSREIPTIAAGPIERLTGQPFAAVPAVWQARVQASPFATFLIVDGTRHTYTDAARCVANLAEELRVRVGVRSGDRVASFLGNTASTLWVWLGSLTAGARYCPLNRAHKGVLLAEMLARTGARVLITDALGISDLERQRFECPLPIWIVSNSTLAPWSGNSTKACDAEPPSEPPSNGDQPGPFAEALLIYTSGSTGRSKAVRLSHVALTHGAARVVDAWAMRETDVFHAWLPHFHIAGLLHQSMASIVAGGAIALFPTFSASRFWDQVHTVRASVVIGLPNVMRILWNTPPNPDQDQSTLRLWVSTAIDPTWSAEFERRFGVKLLDQYGMTEAELVTLPRADENLKPGSCGRAGPDWQLAILDEQDRELPRGEVGEIAVRPRIPGILMLGYEGDEAATARSLRNAWFHCGDAGYLDTEGNLFFVDRRKHAIRRRGENISSLELERLVMLHPAVEACAAVGVPSPLGEEDVKIVVELKMGQALSPGALHAFCREHCAAFMVPRFIEIVAALPRTAVGKADKDPLRQLTGGEWDAQLSPS